MYLLNFRRKREQTRKARSYTPSLHEDHGEALEKRFLAAIVFTKRPNWLLYAAIGDNTPVSSATHAWDNGWDFVTETYQDPYTYQLYYNTLEAGNTVHNLENTASGPNGGALLSLAVDHTSTFNAEMEHENYPWPQSGSWARATDAKWDITGSNNETTAVVRVQFDLSFSPSDLGPYGEVVTWPYLDFESNQISVLFNTDTAYGVGIEVYDNTAEGGPELVDREIVDWRGEYSYRFDEYFEINIPTVQTVSYLSSLDITMNQMPVGWTFSNEDTQFQWSFSVTAVQ